MKIAPILVSMLFVSTALLALAPTAEAAAYCSSLKGDAHCSYYVCYGHSWDSRGERCNVGVREFDCVTRPCWYPAPDVLP